MMLTPTAEALLMRSLRDPELAKYHWGTRVRITEDGETISDVVDVLDAPIDCDWGVDEFGQYAIVPEVACDMRHYAVRVLDDRVWRGLLGDHSPADEIKFGGGKSPLALAKRLVKEYRSEARALSDELGLTMDELLVSLERTIRYEGMQ